MGRTGNFGFLSDRASACCAPSPSPLSLTHALCVPAARQQEHCKEDVAARSPKPPPCSPLSPVALRAALPTRSSNSQRRTQRTAELSRCARKTSVALDDLTADGTDHPAGPLCRFASRSIGTGSSFWCGVGGSLAYALTTDLNPARRQHSFRAAPSNAGDAAAAQQFFQQPGRSNQPFNLSPLQHALPSSSSSAASTPPAWAQAFVAQAPVLNSNAPAAAAEQEMFARAFGGGGGATKTREGTPPAWVGDFQHHHAASSVQQPSPAQQQQGLSRLQGQGFAMHPPPPSGLMVNYLRPAPNLVLGEGAQQMMVTPESMATAREREGKAGENPPDVSPPPLV